VGEDRRVAFGDAVERIELALGGEGRRPDSGTSAVKDDNGG
jgi:hypothetical protein